MSIPAVRDRRVGEGTGRRSCHHRTKSTRYSPRKEAMKYMLMLFGDETVLSGKSQEWVQQMIQFMIEFTDGLKRSGGLLADEGRALAPHAKFVSLEDGAVAVRDGTFAEPSQSLAGWWL